LHICELVAGQLDAVNQYLVDVRQQFVVDQHFGMVDDVLETLIVTPQSGSDPANQRSESPSCLIDSPSPAIHSALIASRSKWRWVGIGPGSRPWIEDPGVTDAIDPRTFGIKRGIVHVTAQNKVGLEAIDPLEQIGVAEEFFPDQQTRAPAGGAW